MAKFAYLLQRMFASKTDDSREAALNLGLHFAMAFGKNWQVPINSRLAKHYPKLSEHELRSYNLLCQDALKYAHKSVASLFTTPDKIAEFEHFEALFANKYPWVNEKNKRALYKQGLYYAQKVAKP